MKVLMTHERFPPDIVGGGEYVVLRTAQYLQKHGVELKVLTTGPKDQVEFEGVQTTRLPIHRYRFNLAVRQIMSMARDVDVIQTFNYQACLPSLVAGRMLGKPVVCLLLSVFGPVWLEMKGPIIGRAIMTWEKFLVTRKFARLVYLSDYSRQIAVDAGASVELSGLIRLGIDLEKYSPARNKDHIVLFAGKLDVRKGILDLMAAARSLPGVSFRVMGWGDGESEVRRVAPANVEFVTFERGAPLREAFSRASIFALPSKAEGFPIALLEAMASGCAVVSTLPLDYAGEKIGVGDQRLLTDAISRLWNDRDRVKSMGMENRRLAETYTWDQYAETLLDYYDQACSENSPRRR